MRWSFENTFRSIKKGISNIYDYDDDPMSDMLIIFSGFQCNHYTYLSVVLYLEAYGSKLAFGLNKLMYPYCSPC